MTVPAISQQLRKLKDGGIIFGQREGTVIFYSLVNKHRKIVEGVLGHSLNKELLAV